MKWKIGCIQMDIAFGNPEKNFTAAEQWFEKAAKEQCSIVVLPELWTTGYDLTRLDEIAHEEGTDVLQFLQEQAKKHKFHIVGGSVAKKVDSGVTNTMYVIDKDGKLVHEYSKLHLFQLMDEHLFLQAGEDEPIFTIDGEKAGSFICYDIRFPEWLRKSVMSGAKALFVVAEWPTPRVDHWRILLQARAIENQCYIIACNRTGADANNEFAGHSMIIDPWGTIISEGGSGEELLIGEIDLHEIDEIRSRIPIFDDRRPNKY
ncbi:carbon-nitrogen family hydrolase [Bacillus sp. FJAT-49732]|uniref:Carbon-nitrogen family hydrolase n=1 Tax=Lederbergia citrisecunda TaxID=2833583 RepID=A0A942TTS4_9BACI|nr:carbon-nitrogen family hydrolase [Lederbergia citrisecunda]MBS4201614.1 carbon-nitrogen family hydrolase [Lederbergia citrisecunda]